MDKAILSKLLILLFAITIISTVFNSCTSNDKSSMGNLFSGKAEIHSVPFKSNPAVYLNAETRIIDTE